MKCLLHLLTILVLLTNCTFGAETSRPNVILMLADDLGYGEPGCYGNPHGRTPRIDRLAAQGVRFTNAYAAFNVCSPSRAALLTGRYTHRLGPVFEDYFGARCPGLDPKRDVTLGQMARDAGYATACFGKWNVSHNKTKGHTSPNAFGFDSWVGLHLNHNYYSHRLERGGELDLYRDGEPWDSPGVWSDTIFADEAIRFIGENRQRPFFIYLGWQAPHAPFQDPNEPNAAVIPGHKAENRTIVEKMIARLDLEIGRVLDSVEHHGLTQKTVVVLTSDNGGALNISRNAPLRGWKQELWEGGIRVPLIVLYPGHIPVGRTVDSPVIHMDLTATIAGIMGAKAPPQSPFDGVDLMPLLSGTRIDLGDRSLFWRRQIAKGAGLPSIRQSSVRRGDWTYIRSYRDVGDSDANVPRKDYDEELFNLKQDVGQTANRVIDEPERLAELRSALDGWEKEMAVDAAQAARAE